MFNVSDTEFGLMLRAKRDARIINDAQALVDRKDGELAAAYHAIRALEAMVETERGLRLKAEDTLDRIMKLPLH